MARLLALLGGNATASALLLARNLLIAHLLPIEDYGIAATFAVAMALVEMASQFGMQAQIVQSPEGGGRDYLAAVHGFQIARGGMSALALFLCAGPISAFLGMPDLAWAYRVLALAPLIRAFHNFDIHRQTRAMRFGPVLLTATSAAAISFIAIFPLAYLAQDWRIMLGALLIQEICACLTSHIMAERPYRVSADLLVWRRSVRFGWPILLQGVVLFAVFQGDKILVARSLGFEALGVFAMGVTISLAPTLVVTKSLQSWFLPQLSRAMGTSAFRPAAVACAQATLLSAIVLCAGVMVAGPVLIDWALGPAFQALGLLLPWMAVQQALRVCRAGMNTAALACGVSWLGAATDLIRALSLPAVWVILSRDGTLLSVVFVAILAEVAGTALALFVGSRRVLLPVRALGPALVVTGVALSGLPVLTLAFGQVWTAGAALLSCGGLLTFSPQLRRILPIRFLASRHSFACQRPAPVTLP